MNEKILKFSEYFKKINEAEGDEDTEEGTEELDNEGEDDMGNDFEGNDLEDIELGAEDEEADDEDDVSFYNERPEEYIESALEKIERRILSYFVGTDKEEETGVFTKEGLELISHKITKMPMNYSLKVKFSDNDYIYHLVISIPLEEGIPEKPDMEMDTNMVEYCAVDFKKYTSDGDYIGDIDLKKELCDEIDADYIMSLNVELDNEYGITDNDLEIEYGE